MPGKRTLASHYGVAVLCYAPGRLLVDYHTAQVPPTRGKRRFATRAAELAAPDLATILSRRDYRTGAWHLAALWACVPAPRWALPDIAAAMLTPVFTPYLGRKGCPLGLPLAPEMTEASDPANALAQRHQAGPEAAFRTAMADAPSAIVVARDDWGDDGANTRRIEIRRDQPLSRRLWQFGLRREVVEGLPAIEPAA